MNTEIIFKIICGLVVFVMICFYFSAKRKIRSFIFGSLSGALALFLICKYGSYINVEVPMNIFNFVGSSILGIPFVIILVILLK